MEDKVQNTERVKRDHQLVNEALYQGNQKAYAQLMQHYREPIYYMLLKMVHNPYDAEDLTIEAFGKAFRNLEKFTDNYAFSTWIFKIAVNNCIDFIRKKNCSPNCIDHDIAHAEETMGDMYDRYLQETPEDTFIAKQKIKIMHQAVEQLRPKYRRLVELRYYEELSYEEIAQELDISLSNVKVQLFRAKDMLNSIMANVKYVI